MVRLHALPPGVSDVVERTLKGPTRVNVYLFIYLFIYLLISPDGESREGAPWSPVYTLPRPYTVEWANGFSSCRAPPS
jgi:hypothetical protein